MNNKLLVDSLKKLRDAVEKNDIGSMRALSSFLIRTSVDTQDEDVIAITMISYSLSKVFQKSHFRGSSKWNAFCSTVSDYLSSSILCIENKDLSGMRINFRHIFTNLIQIDSEVGHYVDWVIDKAKIKHASTLYALGFSLGMSAQLTGASIWELMQYAGKTKIVDEEDVSISLQNRLNIARKIFGGYI